MLKTLKADLLLARKNKNQQKISLLSTLIGEIETILKSPQKKSENELVISTLTRFSEKSKEVLKLDIIPERRIYLEEEVGVLDNYLVSFKPTQLSEEELKSIITNYIGISPINRGLIMKQLAEQYPGKYQAKLAANIITEIGNASKT